MNKNDKRLKKNQARRQREIQKNLKRYGGAGETKIVRCSCGSFDNRSVEVGRYENGGFLFVYKIENHVTGMTALTQKAACVLFQLIKKEFEKTGIIE